MDERPTEAVSEFLRDTRVGCMVTARRPLEAEDREDTESEQGGLERPQNVLSSIYFLCLILSFLLFGGLWGKGERRALL